MFPLLLWVTSAPLASSWALPGNPDFCEGAAVQELIPPTSGLALVCFPKSLWVGSLKSPAARADWAVLAHEKEGGKSRFQDRALAAI